MNWQKGRQLASATNGTTSVAYTYDSEGLRLTKATGDLVYHYYYADGKLVRIHLYKGATSWQIFDFFYDQNGHPYALNHKVGGVYTTYYYLTNLQGDVLGMVKADGTTVATYTYDPYGKPLTATGTFAATNPLRYRGYCYDPETGLYYLQSRYYDPELGRFLNADAFASTGQGVLGNNMFAYCGNNPVNCLDPSGDKHIWIQLFEDHDYGFLHRVVQAHILETHNVANLFFGKELYLPGIGRADIYGVESGEIWEIKHAGSTLFTRASRILEAERQIDSYITGNNGLRIGKAGTFNGAFVVNYENVSYLITYETPLDGIILYSVGMLPSLNPEPYKVYVPKPALASKAAIAGALSAIGVFAAGSVKGFFHKAYSYSD